MTCAHTSITQANRGATSKCISCGLDLIHDGTRWTWLYGMEKPARDRLIAGFNVDRLIAR